MLSIVNYGSSDSDSDNISDEEEDRALNNVNGAKKEQMEDEELIFKNSQHSLRLPEPVSKQNTHETVEEIDEFLSKKEVADVKPPPKIKEKVKITIPRLKDLEDTSEEPAAKYPTVINKKSGLLNLLPNPSKSSVSAPKPMPAPQKPITNSTNSASTSSENAQNKSTKKIGLIPYALMEHKKSTAESKSKADSDDSDEEIGSFFTFSTNDEDLPKVNDEEVKAMIERETNRREKRKVDEQEVSQESSDPFTGREFYDEMEEAGINSEAIQALVGGSKAKRAKMNDIQIVDINDSDVLPNKEEWLRKNLAGETSFIPTGKINEKGPSALAKRKHQISYLALRAENNISELEAMWAANRSNKRESKSKYGF